MKNKKAGWKEKDTGKTKDNAYEKYEEIILFSQRLFVFIRG
jgi:hypothetical protein